MLKRLSPILLLILLVVLVNAKSVSITSIEDGQEFAPNGEIPVALEFDFVANDIQIWLECNNQEEYHYFVEQESAFPEFQEFAEQSFPIPIGYEGVCLVEAYVHGFGFGEGFWGYLNPTYYTEYDSKLVYIQPLELEDATVTVIRNAPEIFDAGGIFKVTLEIIPEDSETTGFIIKEKRPTGMSFVISSSFDYGDVDEQSYEMETQEKKFLILGAGDTQYTINYYLMAIDNLYNEPLTPGEDSVFEGTWEVLGETGPITGDQTIQAGLFIMPECPITDQQLLGYIDQWNNHELATDDMENDNKMLQIIEVWKTC
ncbi:hypothetical protein KKE06_01390 [Candidatus Micrarchaeota archaeon]|nr:hypothetical protein [Candidatus Micrarchaeota archaeon]MBU1930411.1 hypothetical protein [Candidatus Micrarchaeota archaeon]